MTQEIKRDESVNESIPLEPQAREAAELKQKTLEQLGQILVDLDDVVFRVLISIVAGGHALLEGVPGTAKTTLCRGLATVLGLDYRRIQFTPDLLPSDVTGTRVFDQSTSKFELQTGPVFCQFLLADELNRAPARTQSALLEAMQERQVTIEGETLPLPEPFVVLATQNPVEQEGVYRLPEAQLDRFLLRIHVGYPDRGSEIDLLDRKTLSTDILSPVTSTEQIQRLQKSVDAVYCTAELKAYIVDLVRSSREHSDVLLGASPRAALFLLRAARARALLLGRVFFTHEDVQEVVNSVLEHRIIIRPEAELSGRQVSTVIDEVVKSVPVRESR